MAGFTDQQWNQINSQTFEDFGLPSRRSDSIVMGTFNALKLGKADDSAKRWEFLDRLVRRFDLLAIQEVMDDLSGVRRLLRGLGSDYELVVSDTTGKHPGARRGLTERLAFIYRTNRVVLNELVSDITHDRSWVLQKLYADRDLWDGFFTRYERRRAEAEEEGRTPPSITKYAHPAFLTFMRQPHCAAFTIKGRGDAEGVPFLAVNAHLLYGQGKRERKREFDALLDWLIYRAQQQDRMYHRNMILFGDLNLEFELASTKRDEIDEHLKSLNGDDLAEAEAAKVNFPLLSPHPELGLLKTNARESETYDQLGFFSAPGEDRLPIVPQNAEAGQRRLGDYDYGVFRFTELFSRAVESRPYSALTPAKKKSLLSRTHADVSDHLPVWARVRIPGA